MSCADPVVFRVDVPEENSNRQIRIRARGRARVPTRRARLLLSAGGACGGCQGLRQGVSRQDRLCGEDQRRGFRPEGARRRRHQRLRCREPGRVRRRARHLQDGRASLHASGQVADRHPARARALWHPRDVARPRGRDRQALADRARARPRSRRHHALRPAAYARAGGLRAVTKIRSVALARRGAAAAHRSDRLPRRPLLPCRKPDRGRGSLSAGARFRRLGQEPRRSSARRRLDVGGGFPATYGPRPAARKSRDAALQRADGGASGTILASGGFPIFR